MGVQQRRGEAKCGNERTLIGYLTQEVQNWRLINQENKLMRPVDFLLSLSGNSIIS